MNEETEIGADKTKEKKEKVKNWLKNPYNLILVGTLIFAFIVRIYFLSSTQNQPLWWDEGEYMLKAKNIAFGTPDTGWWFGRPILFPFIAALFLKIGFGEIGLRLLFFLISFSVVLLLYLIGKELFNSRVGLVAALLYSVFYVDLFYTSRLLVDLPQVFFIVLAGYFFIRGYLKNKNNFYTWLVIPALAIGILVRFTVGLFLIVLIIFLLFTERLRFLKKKSIWISAVLGFLVYLPYWIWSYVQYNSLNPFYVIFYTLGTTQGRAPGATPFNVFMTYIKYLPSYSHYLLYAAFLIGLIIVLYQLALGFDFIRKEGHIKNKFMVLLWMIIPLIYFGFFVNHFEDRYIFMIFPAVFLITGFGIDKIFSLIKKYSKPLAVLAILAILAFGSYQMLLHSNTIIKDKIISYRDLKETGTWIKQNSAPGTAVLSSAIPELTYYTERAVYSHGQNLSEELSLIKEKNVSFLEISAWEKSPDWIYNFLSQNQTLFSPVYQSSTDYQGNKFFSVVFAV